jgi:CRP/FNR family transcriptional regulator, cyclic AMP receptor protein
MGLKQRFEDRSSLVEALLTQRMVLGDRALAEDLAAEGVLEEFAAGQYVIRQGDPERDVYFILAGKMQVIVHGVRLYPREAGVTVGEMSAVNSAVGRAATIEASEEVVTWRVDHTRLAAVADKHPTLWKRLAIELAGRLEQRNNFISRINETPRIFIICSAEALDIAKSIRVGLEHVALVVIWSDENIFPPGGYAIEALEEQVNMADFGIALAEPDDLVLSRDRQSATPRDNVVFELGFFMSRLGRPRTLLLVPKKEDVKLPSDFKGLTPIYYQKGRKAADLPIALGPCIDRIQGLVKQLGARSSISTVR